MASTSSVLNESTPTHAPPPTRHARVLGKKKKIDSGRPAAPHMRVSSDSSIKSNNSSVNGSQPGSPARLESPVSIAGSVESSSSVTSEETSTAQNATLACPICGESMVTLLQLNRHIDDVHSEIEKTEEDQIKSWFKKKVVKAKQLQSVTSVFSTKFSKLDLFDMDDSGDGSSTAVNTKKPPPASANSVPVAPPVIVTKAHWQKPTGFDKCSDIVCERPLNTRNGMVNCRKCGKLFCTLHTKYQMKLDKDANHDPENGAWSRVCETCYKSRPGYSDTTGASRNLFSEFKTMRQTRIDKYELDVNKLEKRLIKLIKVLLDPKFTSEQTNIFSYSKATQRRNAERQIIAWEDDASVSDCPICQNQFGYSLRKHHCRLCGRVVCASHATNCSRDAPLSILVNKLGPHLFDKQKQYKPRNDISIRICTDCKNIVFSKRNFESEINGPKPELLRFYDTLKPIKRSIEIVLPKFQNLLTEINDPEKPPSPELLHQASRIRKRLLESFVQFDTMSRKVMAIRVHTEEEARLQKQIYHVAAQYLQENMLPLKALPKILKKHNKPSQLSEITAASTLEDNIDSTVLEGEGNEETLSPKEIQSLREQLIVLEEQKFLVNSMISEANSRRKFDEIEPLQQSINDLDKELENIRAKLGSNAI